MKLLKIENSDKMAVVDDHNYERLSKFTWFVTSRSIKRSHRFICKETAIKFFGTKNISLASEIMNQPDVEFDHADKDIYNNLELNFRIATKSQQCMNRNKFKGKYTSIFKGVSWDKNYKKWRRFIAKDGVEHVKFFDTEINAAISYNEMAMKLHGEFAVLNPVPFTW